MRRIFVAFVVVALVWSGLGWGGAAAQAERAKPLFYVSLGDSLAASFQPGPSSNHKGYVEDLWRDLQGEISGLDFRKFGCPGETTRTLTTGDHSHCKYPAGSQLDAAVRFLEQHQGQVPFVTIDVGANDAIFGCFHRNGVFSRHCVIKKLPHVQHRLTVILNALRTATGPDVPIVAMNYYTPFLGFWGLLPHGHSLARIAQRTMTTLNRGLTTTYLDAGVVVADVAATYDTDNFKDTVVVPGVGRVPVNVANTCRWTWFCSKKHTGDPHSNNRGYHKVANTFAREIRPLLP